MTFNLIVPAKTVNRLTKKFAWEYELEEMIHNDPRLQKALDCQKHFMKQAQPDLYDWWFGVKS